MKKYLCERCKKAKTLATVQYRTPKGLIYAEQCCISCMNKQELKEYMKRIKKFIY